MRVVTRTLQALLAFLCLAIAVPAWAQTAGDQPAGASPNGSAVDDPSTPAVSISLEQMQDLQQWTKDFVRWQKAVDHWLTLPRQGSWDRFLSKHRKPDPPAWLDGACVLLADDKDFVEGCGMLERWREDPFTVRSRKAAAATISQHEAPKNSVWWRNVHLDGLWSTTQSNVSVFGLFGMHLTVPVEGRMQIFVTPGILMVSVPTLYNTREVRPATDWGVSYRLFELGQTATVHFNLVHAWMLQSRANLANPQMTLAGFSLSFKPVHH